MQDNSKGGRWEGARCYPENNLHQRMTGQLQTPRGADILISLIVVVACCRSYREHERPVG